MMYIGNTKRLFPADCSDNRRKHPRKSANIGGNIKRKSRSESAALPN